MGVKKALFFNMIGRAVTMVCSIVFVRFYIQLLGVEGYALCGVQTMLTGLLVPLEMGLSTTFNREIAALGESPGNEVRMRGLFRSLLVVYGVLCWGGFIGLVTIAPWVAEKWVVVEHLPVATVRTCLILIAGVVMLQFPILLFTGGLQGLQKHLAINACGVLFTMIRMGGVVPYLWFSGATPERFWVWNLVWTAGHAVILGSLLVGELPKVERAPWFDRASLWRLGGFSAGVAGTGLMGVLLTQVDKLVLSRLLSLEQFGVYTLAYTAASGLNLLVGPVFTVFFPRLSALAANSADRGQSDLRLAYHQGCQVMSMFTLPTTLIGAWFSFPLLRIWLGESKLAAVTSPTFSVYLVGSCLNSMLLVPYALQLAKGVPWITFRLYTFGVLLFIPLVAVLGSWWGMAGGGLAWLLVNLIFVGVGIPATHHYLFPHETAEWARSDLLKPLSGAIVGWGLVLILEMIPFWIELGLVRWPANFFIGIIFSGLCAEKIRPSFMLFSETLLRRPILKNSGNIKKDC